MALQIQLRSGTAAEHDTFTGALGEVTVDTTNKTLRVHDGSNVGGTRLVALTGGLIPASQLPNATTTVKGAVILNNTLTSTSITTALTAAQGKALADQDFGVGQTWQNVRTSRDLNTTYTNSTGKPIYVIVKGVATSAGINLTLVVDGLSIFEESNIVNSPPIYGGNVSGVVPVGSTYSVTSNVNTTISKWVELR